MLLQLRSNGNLRGPHCARFSSWLWSAILITSASPVHPSTRSASCTPGHATRPVPPRWRSMQCCPSWARAIGAPTAHVSMTPTTPSCCLWAPRARVWAADVHTRLPARHGASYPMRLAALTVPILRPLSPTPTPPLGRGALARARCEWKHNRFVSSYSVAERCSFQSGDSKKVTYWDTSYKPHCCAIG